MPSPTSVMSPAISWPGANGRGGLNWYLSAMISVSGKFTPAALTATRTWPLASGLEGSSMSFRLSGPPGVSLIIARIGYAPSSMFRPVTALIRWWAGQRPSMLEGPVRGEEDGGALLRGIHGWPGVRPRLDAHGHGNGQRAVQFADHERSASAPRRGVRLQDRVWPAHRQQPVHARPDDRHHGERHHARHHSRQPRHDRRALPQAGLPRRHAAREDHRSQPAREQVAAGCRHRRVQSRCHQPARRDRGAMHAPGADAQEAKGLVRQMRSFLFVPGDSERKLAKGPSSGPEGLILDLEDSVATDRKKIARDMVLAYLKSANRAGP